MSTIGPVGATPQDAMPGPNGCPAIHILASERRAFAESVKDPVNALWRILELSSQAVVADAAGDSVADLLLRIQNVSYWALGNKRAVKDKSDLEALAELSDASGETASPALGATPASPGKTR